MTTSVAINKRTLIPDITFGAPYELPTLAARAAKPAANDVIQLPSYVSKYPPAQVSSACTCFITAPAVVTTTTVHPIVLKTSTKVVVTSATTTITVRLTLP